MMRLERSKQREESGRVFSPASGFLGLGRVIPRLIAEDGFEGREAALRCVSEYERFFMMAARQRSEPLVPSFRVDLIWQRHMLDTRTYSEDCARWGTDYLHRDSGAPTDGFERCLGLLGTFDRRIWDRPGPAFVRAISDGSAVVSRGEPGESLDQEDFSVVLDSVRRSLRHKPTAPAWVVEARELLDSDASLAVEEYRRFLKLLILERGPITPCKLVDEFWHQHILDSRNYVRFCSRTAGRYLHHEPHYERPHRSHTPGYRRTLLLYRERMGTDPPGQVWAHMGESGGGDGGSGGGSPPPPLYVVDGPCEVRAHLKLGGVDRRHYKRFHPVFAEKRLPKDLWHGLLRAIDAAPRISWADFVAIKGNSPARCAAVTVGSWVGLVLFLLIIFFRTGSQHQETGPVISAGESLLGLSLLLAFFLLAGALSYAGRWSRRPYVSGEARRIVARFSPVFRRHGVILAELDDDAQTIRVEADTHREAVLRRQAEERQRLIQEAEDRRLAAEAEQKRHDEFIRRSVRRRAERARRRAERNRRRDARDAYYIDQGVEPGPFAWFHVLPQWVQSILLWLAIVVPLTLAIHVWFYSF